MTIVSLLKCDTFSDIPSPVKVNYNHHPQLAIAANNMAKFMSMVV